MTDPVSILIAWMKANNNITNVCGDHVFGEYIPVDTDPPIVLVLASGGRDEENSEIQYRNVRVICYNTSSARARLMSNTIRQEMRNIEDSTGKIIESDCQSIGEVVEDPDWNEYKVSDSEYELMIDGNII